MMKDIFGDSPVHARAAVGVNSFLLGFTVEIEAMFKIKS
jgi:Putative translation initiation inhibitor, yjgF family